MTEPACRFLNIAPLLPTSDYAEFVSKLQSRDVRARFGRPVEPETLPALLAPVGPDYRAIGAWNGKSLVGAAMVAKLTNGQCEYAVLVRSDMQRRRIGCALTYSAFDEARDLGASQIVAHARSDNTAAQALLRSTGFCPISEPGLEVCFMAQLAPSHAFGSRAIGNARAEREHVCRR